MASFDLVRIQNETEIATLEQHLEIDSTNDRAIQLLAHTSNQDHTIPLPLLILTDHQTAGRGQFNRNWISQKGNLTLSLCLASRDKFDLALPLAVGVAICEAIESKIDNVQLQLKWPNDLFLNDRKLGGILIEQVVRKQPPRSPLSGSKHPSPKAAVIGIGVNVNQPILIQRIHTSEKIEQVESKQTEPISLIEATGKTVDLTDLTIELVKRVMAAIAELKTNRRSLLDRCHQRMIFLGRALTLALPNGQVLVGQYEGLSELGELVLNNENNRFKVSSALEIGWK